MLIKRALVLAVALVWMGPGTTAWAESTGSGGVACSETTGICIIEAETPAQPGDTSGDNEAPDHSDSGPAKCRDKIRNVEVPCNDPNRGWWDSSENCYYLLADPQPPVGDDVWAGHTAGAIYLEICPWVEGAGGMRWRATPPQGYGGISITPEELAQRAVERLSISGPDIQMTPEVGQQGLVGLPVWMWTTVSTRTWGPLSATASVPGLSVTARAHASKIVWDMGDGTTVTCNGPGTHYRSEYQDQTSPDCGHVYERASASESGNAYQVTATTTWRVDWSGGGRSGRLTVTRSSSVDVPIGELQVLVS